MLNYNDYKDLINSRLIDFIPEIDKHAETIKNSMMYSLKAGGKRLRPVLLLASCDFAGGNITEALPYACAIEYIHTYSLIHDDLPAMDDDDLRRGIPTNHKVFGEDMAILAGDGLLNTAAQIMSEELTKYLNDTDKLKNHINALNTIIKSAGVQGMVAGQVADVENQYADADAELVDFIEANKTGRLLSAPVIAGLQIAGAGNEVVKDFEIYAANLGKAFQISDDILDEEGDEKSMGKRLRKDQDAGKCSYVCVHGMDAAKAKLRELTNEAILTLSKYGSEADFFTDLVVKLESREA